MIENIIIECVKNTSGWALFAIVVLIVGLSLYKQYSSNIAQKTIDRTIRVLLEQTNTMLSDIRDKMVTLISKIEILL